MSLPVIAKNDLDGYILDTEIVVKIPKDTEGFLVQEMRKDIVIVQFNIPTLGALRVSRNDLKIADALDVIQDEMERVRNLKPFVEKDAHRAADALLIRALNHLKTNDNAEQISHILRIYEEIPKHYL